MKHELVVETYDYSAIASIRGRTLDKVTLINFDPNVEIHQRVKDAALRAVVTKKGEVIECKRHPTSLT